MIKQFIW